MSKSVTITIDDEDLNALTWVWSVAETDRESYPLEGTEKSINEVVQASIDHVEQLLDRIQAALDQPALGPEERSVQ